MKLRKYALKIDVYDHATIKEREAKKGKILFSYIKFQFERDCIQNG
jgi:hypothetical protein